MQKKKLYKIEEGKVLDGVCGGVAEYLGIDPTVIRVIWAVIGLSGGFGILAYFACMMIIPRKPTRFIDAE